ncbi:hypothetical protein L0F63_004252 [Massospora cicadina]|nr:hypothetical protein L0F63_004252 [Massospora cicadina]
MRASLSQVHNYMDEILSLALRGVENTEMHNLIPSNCIYELPTINFPGSLNYRKPDFAPGPITSPKGTYLDQPCDIPEGVIKIPTGATLKRVFGSELVEDEPSSPKTKRGKFHHPSIVEPLRISSCCQDDNDVLATTSPGLEYGLSATPDYVASEPTSNHMIPELAVAELIVPETINLVTPEFAVAKPASTEPAFPTQVAPELGDLNLVVPEVVDPEPTAFELAVAEPTFSNQIAPELDNLDLVAPEFVDPDPTSSEHAVVEPAFPAQVVPGLVGHNLVIPESVATEYTMTEAVNPEHVVTDHLVPEFMAPISVSSEQTDLDISQGSLMSEDYFACDSYETISASEYATSEDGGSPVLVKQRRRRRQVQSYQLKVASSRELSGLLPLPREVATPYMLRRTLPADTPSKRRRLNPLMPDEGGPTYATSLTRAIATPYTLRENNRGSSQNPDASNPSFSLINPKTPHSTLVKIAAANIPNRLPQMTSCPKLPIWFLFTRVPPSKFIL